MVISNNAVMGTKPNRQIHSEEQAYDELRFYTLAHEDPAFIHQHVVDAWAAQHANKQTKAITLAFALIGLYLHIDRGYSGREVQRVHMRLARDKHSWPSFPLPPGRGEITARDVMTAPPGSARDDAIDRWCESVWRAFADAHEMVVELLARHRFT